MIETPVHPESAGTDGSAAAPGGLQGKHNVLYELFNSILEIKSAKSHSSEQLEVKL